MIKIFRVLGTIALLAALAFSFAACDDLLESIAKDNPTTVTDTYLPMSYTSYDANGTRYDLTIARPSKAAVPFTPAAGDSYTLIITTMASVTQTSRGTVKDFSGSKFTLTSSNNVSVSFEVTISGNAMTNITGTITIESGGTVDGPGSLMSVTGFVAVTNISGVPASGTVGTPITLSGTVEPSNATSKTIVWSVKSVGTTGAAKSGDTLSTTSAGTVTVTATIANGKAPGTPYTQDFNIVITGNGKLTITDIPSRYNEKYALFYGYYDSQGGRAELVGIQGFNVSTRVFTLVRISDGKVIFPVWMPPDDDSADNDFASLVRYSGNDKVKGAIAISDSETVNGNKQPEFRIYFDSISFSYGNATISFNEAIDTSLKPGTGEGTLTVTDIPSDYNGKYAMFSGYSGYYIPSKGGLNLIGIQGFNASTEVITLPLISDGEVILHVWMPADDGFTAVGYSGSDKVKGAIGIFNSGTRTSSEYSQPIFIIEFDEIQFSDGNATISWNDGSDEDDGGGSGGGGSGGGSDDGGSSR